MGGTRLGLYITPLEHGGSGSHEIYLILSESNFLSCSKDIPLDFTQGNKLAIHKPRRNKLSLNYDTPTNKPSDCASKTNATLAFDSGCFSLIFPVTALKPEDISKT